MSFCWCDVSSGIRAPLLSRQLTSETGLRTHAIKCVGSLRIPWVPPLCDDGHKTDTEHNIKASNVLGVDKFIGRILVVRVPHHQTGDTRLMGMCPGNVRKPRTS